MRKKEGNWFHMALNAFLRGVTATRRRGRLIGAAAAGLLLGCGGLALILPAHAGRMGLPAAGAGRPAALASTTPAPPRPTQSDPVGGPLQAEIVTIHPYGMIPAAITRPRGKFILAVDNRSGADEVDLRLDRDTGARVHAPRVPHTQLDWHEVVDLTPGRYVLSEANHPEWVCEIVITP